MTKRAEQTKRTWTVLRKRSDFTKTIVSLLLCFLMVFEAIPPAFVWAMSSDAEIQETQSIEETENQELEIICEDSSKRDENKKEYLLSDGRYRAIVYPYSVHYKENDEWTDIDNSLELDSSAGGYINKSNDFKVTFAKKSDSKKLVEIKNDDFKLSWGFVNSISNKTAQKKTRIISTDETALNNLSDGLVYYGIYDGVDVEYKLTSKTLKENIIINNSSAQKTFEIEMKLNGADAILNDDNSISITLADGNIAGYIAAPYMFDAKGAYCDDVSVSLARSGNKYTMTITPSFEWLNDQNRAYPVTIDPQISVDAVEYDAYFAATGNKLETSEYRENYLCAGSFYNTQKQASDVAIGALNLYYGPYIYEPQDYIISAKLCVETVPTGTTLWTGDTYANTQINKTIELYASGTYDPCYSTNNISGTPLDAVNVSVTYPASVAEGETDPAVKKYSFNILEHIYDYPEHLLVYSCYYLSEKDAPSTASTGTLPVMFNNARIEYEYRSLEGVENQFTYTEVTVGNAGTAYIGDSSGRVTYVHSNLSTPSGVTPITVASIYNQTDDSQLGYGKGWRTNYSETIIKLSQPQTTSGQNKTLYDYGYRYIWTDSDGTDIYFHNSPKLDENGNPTSEYEIVDDAGKGITLTQNENVITITDSAQNTAEFVHYNGNSYRLVSKKDHLQNTITVSYGNNSSLMIESITNNYGETVEFAYNNGLLSAISEKKGNEDIQSASFAYDENGNLTQITRTGNKTSSFTYNEYGIEKITDVNGQYMVELDYTDLGKVCSIQEYAIQTDENQTTSTIAGQRMEITYQSHMTSFRTAGNDGVIDNTQNSDDILTVYQFDDYGRTVSAYSKSYVGNEFYGAEHKEYTSGGITFDQTQATNTADKFKFNKIKSFVTEGNSSRNLLLNGNFELAIPSTGAKNFCGTNLESDQTPSNYVATSVVSSTQTLPALAGEKILKTTLADSALSTHSAWYAPIACADNLEPSTEYSFSAYVKLDSLSVQNARLCAKIGDAEFVSDVVNNASTSLEWQKLELHFTTPETLSDDVLLCLKLTEGGTAYIDCAQLEKGKAANKVNYAENQGFEFTQGTSSAVWNSSLNTATPFGEKTAYITGDLDETKQISQTIKLSNAYIQSQKRDITVSAWAKADAYIDNETYPNRFFGIRTRIIYYGENGALSYSDEQKVSFNPGVDDWQYTALTLQTDGEKQLYGIEMTLCYDYQPGTCRFDNVSVFDNTVTNYEYDANGNLTRITSGNNETLNTYDGANLVSSVTKENGEVKNTIIKEYSEIYYGETYIKDLVPSYTLDVDAEVDLNGKVISVDEINSATQTIYDEKGRLVYTQTGTELLAYYPCDDGTLTDVTPNNNQASTSLGVTIEEREENSGDYEIKLDEYDSIYVEDFNIPDCFTISLEVTLDLRDDVLDYAGNCFVLKSNAGGEILSINNGAQFNVVLNGNEISADGELVYNNTTYITATFRKYGNKTKVYLYLDGRCVAQRLVNTTLDFTDCEDWIICENVDCYVDNIAFFRGALSEKEVEQWVRNNYVPDYINTADWTEYTYSEDGRFVVKEEHSNGTVVNYTVDDKTGLVTSAVTTTREGVTTRLNYEYNIDKTLNKVYYDNNNNGTHDASEIFNSYTYDAKGNVTSVAHNGTEYEMSYNAFGQRLDFKAGENTLVSYQYVTDANGNIINGALKGQSFAGNSQKTESYIYDAVGRVIGREYNGVKTQQWAYDNSGNIIYENDIEDGTNSRYQYDAKSRLIQHSSTLINGMEFTSSYLYDNLSNVTESAYYIGSATPLSVVNHYSYDEDNRFVLLDNGNTRTQTEYDDKVDQIIKRTVSLKQADGSYSEVACEYYSYYNQTAQGSIKGAISSIEYDADGNENISYTYDSNGNIKTESRNGVLYKTYTYDELGQLTEENIVGTNNRTVYTYDNAGNITGWTKYKTVDGVETQTASESFGYTNADWGDLLTSYKGLTVYYDAMGNPTVFSDYKFTWENGRELAVVKNRSTNAEIASYEYNSAGMRISKTTSDGTAYYAYDENNNLIYEKHNNYSMVFHYDGNGVRTHFDYAGTSVNGTYYYRYNAQGDVIALLDSTGAIAAEYDYTAYGILIHNSSMMWSSVAERNPFRYRGYYYDNETGLYYLNSRYYDAYLGRFISADKVIGINRDMATNNLFVYCGNNPITFIDRTGESATVAAGTTITLLWPILKEVVVVIIKGATVALAGEMIIEGSSALKIRDEAKPDLKIEPKPNATPIEITDPYLEPKYDDKPIARGFYKVTLTNPGIAVSLGTEMNLYDASNVVLMGGSVWCVRDYDALMLAMVASGGYVDGNNERRVKNGTNAYHYHLKDRLTGAHLFFGFQAVVFYL